jgi:hypothetical protein
MDMKKFAAVLAVGALTFTACGGSDGDGGGSSDKDKIAASMLESGDMPEGIDESCVRGKINDLSDSDAKLIADNIDSPDMPEGLSEEGQGLIIGMLDCIDFSDLDLGDLDE